MRLNEPHFSPRQPVLEQADDGCYRDRMTLRKSPQRLANDSLWDRLSYSFNEDFMISSVFAWEISISRIEDEDPPHRGPAQVERHKADVHWPVPTHVPENLLPSHFGELASEEGRHRILQRNSAGDGAHLTAYSADFDRDGPIEATYVMLWRKRSYRWRCRIWFLWRQYIRDVWDFLKKPMLIAALIGYPVVHVLAAVGVLGCDCPPLPPTNP